FSRLRSSRPAARASAMTCSGSTRSDIGGPGPPASLLTYTMPITDAAHHAAVLPEFPDADHAAGVSGGAWLAGVTGDRRGAAWLECRGQVAEQGHRLFELVIRVHDQNRVERSRRQLRIRRGALDRDDVGQRLALHAALDDLDHLRLDVFGVDASVGADATRQADGEPPAAGAEIGHDAAAADRQRVHDLFGALPRVAVRPFELSEPGRRKQPRGLCRRERRCTGQHDAGDEGSRAAADHVAVVLDPGIPGDVISSGDRICASLSSGINLRSRTMSAIERPSFTAVLAISAVAV